MSEERTYECPLCGTDFAGAECRSACPMSHGCTMIRCPQCGSSNIEYPQMTRKFLTPALVAVLCALKIIPKEFYCQDCHYTWSNEEERTIGRLWHRFFPGEEKAT